MGSDPTARNRKSRTMTLQSSAFATEVRRGARRGVREEAEHRSRSLPIVE